ncbi:hypothetical protein FPV67DRAFT_872953 [Lyophyllum atratum]|nr:hypothetical protein FPV67DRAFT_872953 [Lyophyllum atratum]
MPIPTLPQELVDVIIDHLRDDRTALATCSVMCKAWLSRSRSHLMADFSISPYDLIIDAVDIASIFSPYTRNLLLNFYAYSLPHEIDLFPSITSLYIMRSEINQGMQYRLSAAFTLITHLELRNTRFAAFDVLANLLCSFPRIQTVMLVGCSWLKETEPSARISPPRGWHTLSIDLSSLDTFLAWFTSLDPLPTLSRLRIDQPHEEHLKHVGAAIRALGTSLRYLTIVLWHADRAAEHINLSRNADLRSLELLCNGSPKLLHDILATHTLRTQLREVKLGLFMSTLMNSFASDWIDLDSLLANAATKLSLICACPIYLRVMDWGSFASSRRGIDKKSVGKG